MRSFAITKSKGEFEEKLRKAGKAQGSDRLLQSLERNSRREAIKLGNRGCTVFDFDFGLRHTGPARISRQDSTCIYSIMEQGNPLTVLPFGKPFLLTSTGSRARRIHL